MANAKQYDPHDDSNSANWTPTVPGIGKVLGIAEAGHESAKAVHDYQMHGAGQMMKADSFRDYDDSIQVSKDV